MAHLLINRWVHTILLLALLCGAIFVRLQDYQWSRALSYLAFDRYNTLRPREAGDQVIIVDIDDESLRRIGQWPWPRTILADLIYRLKEMGAAVVAFDGVLAEPDRTSPAALLSNLPENERLEPVKEILGRMPDHDAVFAEAIKNTGFFVAGFSHGSYEQKKSPRLVSPVLAKKDVKPVFMRYAPFFDSAVTFIPVLEQAAAGNGSFMAFPEIDGIIRKTGIVFHDKKNLYPSLSLEATRISLGEIREPAKIIRNENIGKNHFETEFQIAVGAHRIPVDKDGLMRVYFRKFERERDYLPVFRVLEENPSQNVLDKVRGRIVFIGSSAEGLKDLRSTPLDLFVPGVEIHANAAEQIMQGKYLMRPNILLGAELVFMTVIGFTVILLAPFIGAIVQAALTTALLGAIWYASWHIFLNHGLLLDPVYPSLTILALFVLASLLAYIRTEAERRHVRDAFSHYISPDFMKELTADPDKLKLGGEVRELTVMFTDIRSFTSISERLSPEALIQLMNDFLTPMSALVMDNRGTIDKYMGDAMMAFWNAPLDDSDHARHACLTALKMNAALEPINARLQAEAGGLEPLVLAAGIGINTGPAAVGNMGSKQRFAYSALGDTVNLASRLEGQTKAYGVSVLISEETAKQVPELALMELDLLRVKGKTEPVRIYTLIGDAVLAGTPEFSRWKGLHDQMIAAYRAVEFEQAEKLIAECRVISGQKLENFYAIFLARIADLKTHRPRRAEWDGVFDATSK